MKNDSELVAFLKIRGVNFDSEDHLSYTLVSNGLRPLNVELWYEGEAQILSMAHYFEEDSDLIMDPEIRYNVYRNDNGIIEADPFRIDQLGAIREAYFNDSLHLELLTFTIQWIKNLQNYTIK